MAGRTIPLVNDEYYHVYNRGAAYQPTFLSKWDYEQMLLGLSYYQVVKPPVKLSRFKEFSLEQKKELFLQIEKSEDKLVEIISFVFMPNHFHLLLRQTADRGISTFISRIINSYTRYFNIKHQRPGALFQGVFKAVHVETDEQLVHLSRYIHLNPLVSYVVKEENFLSYPWSSLPEYITHKSSLVHTEEVLAHFSSLDGYKKFIYPST